MANPRDCEGNELPWSSRPCAPGDYDRPVCYTVPPSVQILPGFKRITLDANCFATATQILDQALAPVPGAVETGCPSPCSLCGGGGAADLEVQDEGVSQGVFGCIDFVGAGVTATPGGCGVQVNIPGGVANCAAIQALFPSTPPLLPTDEVLANRGGACVRGPIDCTYMQSLFPSAGASAVGDEFLVERAGTCVRVTVAGAADLCSEIAALSPITPATAVMEIPIRNPGDGVCSTITVQDICDFCGAASFPLLAPDGTCAAPSYSFTNDTDSGMSLDPGNFVFIGWNNCASVVEVGDVIGIYATNGDFIEVGASINIDTTGSATNITLNSGADIVLTAAGDILLTAATGAIVLTGDPGAIGEVITSQGAGTQPIWSFVTQLVNGGTTISVDGTGALLINGSAGLAGQYLGSNGPGVAPTWQTLPTVPAPATTVTVSDAGAGVVGVLTTYAREDHKHSVATGTPVAVGTANSAGVATTLARSDHVHDHGSQPLGTGTNHAVATGAVAGFMSAADKTRFDALLPATTVTTVNAGAGAVGIAVTYAREDHRHSVTTAAPTVTVKSEATPASIGVATSLLRSDAQIQAQTATPSVAVLSDASTFLQGTSSSLMRADARLIATTAAPVSTGTANAAGTSTALSRADHVHRTLVAVQSGGAAVASRPTLNFISGSGITVTPVDNGGSDRVDITISATGGTAVINETAQARRTTSYTLTASFVDIDLQSTDVETNSSVIDHLAGTPDRVTAVAAGTYLVTYNVDIDTPTVNLNNFLVNARVRINDTTVIPGSEARCSVFADSSIENDDFYNHLSCQFVVTLTATQFLTLQLSATDIGAEGDFPLTRAGGVSMTVTRLRA